MIEDGEVVADCSESDASGAILKRVRGRPAVVCMNDECGYEWYCGHADAIKLADELYPEEVKR